MLNGKSLVCTLSRGEKLIQNCVRLQAQDRKHQSCGRAFGSSRFVATSSTSKVPANQLALKQQNEPDLRHAEIEESNSGKYQARLERLSLWHSLDTIKRVGHRLAKLDPLELRRPDKLRDFVWSHSLVEELKSNSSIVPTKGLLETEEALMPISEIIKTVLNLYVNQECGLEFAHLSNQMEVEWLTSQWESLNRSFHLTPEDEDNLAKLLIECEAFDHFMASKYPTTKRYGCEGAESMLVIIDEVLRNCHLSQPDGKKISDVIIGMPHRGRLNLLACLLGFDPAAIFNKTQGEPELDLREAWMARGDVLSHLSTNVRFVYGLDRHHIGLSRETPEPINVSLLPNPSHLEVVSPMVVGAARGRAHNLYHGYSSSPRFHIPTLAAKSEQHDESLSTLDSHYRRYAANILPIQIHGDASLSGQGIIQETLQMANLPQFSVGGSLHIVVNNQIGYTTDATMGRSSQHCTDIFKFIEAPILHVNGENISSIIKATRLALNYRQRFGKDIAIDLICFRKHGHNEMDEPAFTQPLMYANIRQRKSIPQLYCDTIHMPQDKVRQIVDNFRSKLQNSYQTLSSYRADNDDYRNFSIPTEFHRDHLIRWRTGCDLKLLKDIALTSVQTPDNFKIHPNLNRALISDRRQRFSDPQNLQDSKIDWATAEILAFGSLLRQNHSVRIAGQDVARGTFSTRHAVLFDQSNGSSFVPLNATDLKTNLPRPRLEIANTILSEEAALAYEFGYSVETCELSIWEAQFGDFFNTAQSIIDTVISSSESKWLKQSPLTLLLPHGLDGAGPEHSSSHIERFLQLSSSSSDSVDTEAKVNWSVCFPTMPSQYFHLLRRQVLRPFRKPLIVMSPKVIFRHPECISKLSEFDLEQTFMPVLDDPQASKRAKDIDTLVLCSGKVYFTLNELRQKHKMNNIAIIRIEELCPFPIQSIVNVMKKYEKKKPITTVWLQEEHKNQGAYSFVQTRLSNLVAGLNLKYIGREESELPATGSGSLHKRELNEILRQFLSLKRI